MSSSGGAGQREVAYRVFAAEYADADLEHTESDEERAPNYVVTPTGARVNRLFVVGVLTEVESVSEGVLRARVVDPTGAFVCYAGQYQPDEQAFLERADPPLYVALTGKARTFSPEDGDRIFTSVRPEAINEVDADTRDRWTVQAAAQTVARIRTMAGALALEQRGEDLTAVLTANDVDEGLAAGIPLALAHYGTTRAYLAALADVAIEAARLVAGDIDEVEATTVQPAATGEGVLPVDPRDLAVPADGEESPSAPGDSGGQAGDAATHQGVEADGSDSGAAEEPSPAEEETGGQAEVAADHSEAEADGDDAVVSDAPVAGDTGEQAEEAAGHPEDGPGAADAETAEESPPADASSTTAPGDDAGDTEAADGPGAFEPGSFDLDDDERAEVEDEFGTEFQSGAEVDEPGAADIETPGPSDGLDPASAEPAAEDTEDSRDADGDDEETDETAGTATDLEDAVVDAMEALDEGEGAPRPAVIERVVERTGAADAAVEEAIQAALMEGRCFEPADDRLQAI